MSRNVQPSSLGLRDIELLEGLASEKLDALARQCVWRNYEAGKRIISRNADDRDVYLLVSGRVRITTYSQGGRQVTFRDIAAGDIFGEVAALDEKPRSADVIALDSALLASMSPAVFRRLLAEEPLVGGRVMTRLAALVRSLSERVIDLSTLGVQNRIHAEILRLARAAGVARNRARRAGTEARRHREPGQHLSRAGDPRAVGARQGRHPGKGRRRARRVRRRAPGEDGEDVRGAA